MDTGVVGTFLRMVFILLLPLERTFLIDFGVTLGSLRVVFGDGEGGLPFGADFLDEIGDVFGLRCIFKSFAICSLAVMWSNVPSGWSFATSASSSAW